MILAVLLLITVVAHAQPATQPDALPTRQPKYPPKTSRTLYTDEQVVRARENIARYPAAKKIADGIIRSADEWVNWSDEDLTFLLTSPDVPRAFAVSATGCPVCGGEIRKKGNGDYNWIIDPKLPFKVKCPVDGTVFPTNDFAGYYKSGFKEKTGFDTKYADDGWGWTDPRTGEKFWFVAYYNHWNWHTNLVPAIATLGRAYMLTGDEKYAHKAAVMLYRVAQVYPGMDHAKQSRYGQMMAARGVDYAGKVVNKIWETGLAQTLAEGYDAVFDAIDRDELLQKQTGKTGAQIRSFIEANILEDAIDAFFSARIRGNFGMHQNCLVHLALVRQTGENDKWFDLLMNNATPDVAMSGLNDALYNLIYRDGFPSETAPGYNIIWVRKIAEYGDLLQRAGRDVFTIPRTKRLFDAVLDQMVLDARFTPAIGDSSNVFGGAVGKNAELFQTAYRHYKDPRYAALLRSLNATGENTFKSIESLFEPPIEIPAEIKISPRKSRLLDGYGMAILNNASDTVAMSLYYGQKHGHGHFDRLHFDVFANRQPMTPDLGYPDAMNEFVPGIYTWSKNTISHNTVTVDAQRQFGNYPGEVKLFADADQARIVDIEAKETYPQCSTYRRAVVMVDVDDDKSYFVDIFNVAGGKQHDYSLHGPPGEFEMIGGTWSEPAKGTLAGENVELGQIYDNAALAKDGATIGYSSYDGSGFQHLYNVRTATAPGWIAQWKNEKDPLAKVRIRVANQPGQQMFLCDARVSPVNHPQILRYLIARRTADAPLTSRFVSIIEPFRDKHFIAKAIFGDGGSPIEVVLETGDQDTITYDVGGAVNVERVSKSGEKRTLLRSGVGDTLLPPRGVIESVQPGSNAVVVRFDAQNSPAKSELIGRAIRIKNDRRTTWHTVVHATGDADSLTLTFADDLQVGLIRVDAVEAQALVTSSALPLAPCQRGTTLADREFGTLLPVESVGGGRINLVSPLPIPSPFKPGDKLWLLDVGPGDRIEVPFVLQESRHDRRQ